MRFIIILGAFLSVSSVYADDKAPIFVEMNCKGGKALRFRCTARNVEGMQPTWTLYDGDSTYFASGESATFPRLRNRCAPIELRATDVVNTHVLRVTVCTAQGRTAFSEITIDEPVTTRLLRVAEKVVRRTFGGQPRWQVREDPSGWWLVVWADEVFEVPLDPRHDDERMAEALADSLAEVKSPKNRAVE